MLTPAMPPLRRRSAGARENRRGGVKDPPVVAVEDHRHRLGTDPVGREA